MTDPLKLDVVQVTWLDAASFAETKEPFSKVLGEVTTVGFLLPGGSDGCVRLFQSYAFDPEDGKPEYQELILIPDALVVSKVTISEEDIDD